MNTWIRLACLAALTVTLAACAREDQPRADGAQTSAEAGAEAASAAAAKSLKKPLAKNVDLGFRYHLRSDRVQEDKPGVFRRKVLVEYLGLDQQQAASALIADMVEGGYKVASERTNEQGRIRLTFQKGKRKITADDTAMVSRRCETDARCRRRRRLANNAASTRIQITALTIRMSQMSWLRL